MDKAIELDPDSLVAYMARGSARIQLEAYDQAITDLTTALRGPEPPEPAYAYFARGSAFAHKGEHDKALADYDEGLRLKSDDGNHFAIRCAIRAALGQSFDEVMKDCDKAMTMASHAAMVRNMRGFALLKFDKPDRALREFDVAFKDLAGRRPGPGGALLSENQAMLLLGRGLAKRRLGETKESASDLELSAKLSPKRRFARPRPNSSMA